MSKVYGYGIFVHRLYVRFHIIYESSRYLLIIRYTFPVVYTKTIIQSVYTVNGKNQPRLKCHYKFISTKDYLRLIIGQYMLILGMGSANMVNSIYFLKNRECTDE